MIWKDAINKHNPLSKTRLIECVNPCGEATLYNYENCCLGSINLVNHISNGEIDWTKLEKTIRTGVRFLDNVVDANIHVAPEFSRASLSTRRIGLGVTGFADALILLDSRYGSDSSLDIARSIAKFLNNIAMSESKNLAMTKGPYPLWSESWHKEQNIPLRNISLLAIAPEGSRSLISSTSPSIEPNFGRTITRTAKGIGAGTWEHPLAKSDKFVTTYEVTLSEHIKMQAAWQEEMNAFMVLIYQKMN
jgi:ribonucleoside-diphosphate reductase alpha chain